jgi:hypothetical protein
MNFKIFSAGWVALAITVLGLALYRKLIALREDHMIHISGDGSAVAKQVAVAKRLERIDHWGKTLTVVTLVFGLCVVGAAAYVVLQQHNLIN